MSYDLPDSTSGGSAEFASKMPERRLILEFYIVQTASMLGKAYPI